MVQCGIALHVRCPGRRKPGKEHPKVESLEIYIEFPISALGLEQGGATLAYVAGGAKELQVLMISAFLCVGA